MSERLILTQHDLNAGNDMLSPEQYAQSELRNEEFNKIREGMRVPLDEETFDEISRTFEFRKAEKDGDGNISFNARGHKVDIGLRGNIVAGWGSSAHNNGETLSIDGNPINNDQTIRAFGEKYSYLLDRLSKLDNRVLRNLTTAKALDELMK